MEDKILEKVIRVMLDNKANDVVYIQVTNVNPLADYYVIASVDSNRQALAIAKYVSDVLYDNDVNVKHIEGNESSEWILVDGTDYIVHLFVKDARTRDGLEKMWSDLPIIKVG